MISKSMYKSILLSTLVAACVCTQVTFAEEIDNSAVLPPPTLEASEAPVVYETRTIYQSEFLPGVRLCEEDEVDYRGDFRRVNCQDEDVLEALATRDDRVTVAQPNKVFKDDFKASGNILRIDFQRKLFSK